jgi:hypothetical protein
MERFHLFYAIPFGLIGLSLIIWGGSAARTAIALWKSDAGALPFALRLTRLGARSSLLFIPLYFFWAIHEFRWDDHARTLDWLIGLAVYSIVPVLLFSSRRAVRRDFNDQQQYVAPTNRASSDHPAGSHAAMIDPS